MDAATLTDLAAAPAVKADSARQSFFSDMDWGPTAVFRQHNRKRTYDRQFRLAPLLEGRRS